MQTYFKKDGMHHYLVLPTGEEWNTDYQSRMLQRGNVPFFLPCEVRELNGSQMLYYCLQYRTTVKWAVENLPLTSVLVQNMADCMIGALESMETYLLDPEKILWQTDYMFMDAESGKVQFVYYPAGETEGSMKDVLAELLQAVDRTEEQSVLYLEQFYEHVARADFTWDGLKQFKSGYPGSMTEHRQTPETLSLAEEEKAHNGKTDKVHGEKVAKALRRKADKTHCEKDKAKKGEVGLRILLIGDGIFLFALVIGFFCQLLSYDRIPILFFGLLSLIVLALFYMEITKEESPDVIMQEYFAQSGTSLQNADWHLYLKALEEDAYPSIRIRERSIVLGSRAETCNYVLREKGVSRVHAKLEEKKDGIYLLDLNSTNGTFLNGERIESGKDYKLEEGDLVAFAWSEFYVVKEKVMPIRVL